MRERVHTRPNPTTPKPDIRPSAMSATATGSDVLAQLAQLAEGYELARISWQRDPFSGEPQWSASLQQRITSCAIVGRGATPLDAVESLRAKLLPDSPR